MSQRFNVAVVVLCAFVFTAIQGWGCIEPPHPPEQNAIWTKLMAIVIPDVDFQNVPLQSAASRLMELSKKFDPTHEEVRIILEPQNMERLSVSLRLRNAHLSCILKCLVTQTGMKFRLEPDAFIVMSCEKEYPPPSSEYIETKVLAEQGNPDAQWKAVLMCWRGQAGNYDSKQTIKWMRNAAKRGVPGAQLNLGRFYYGNNGDHKPDIGEAQKWMQRAAQECLRRAYQDDAESQNTLAWMYLGGWGVFHDDIEAYRWACLAGEKKSFEGDQYLMKLLKKRMKPEEIAEAKRRKEAFPTTPK